ncbi:IclR family transcriptional regulator C-terminal domain-containing protein [Gordonia sp. w5E2]|nr:MULTISPECIES: IclR family transcriptional regulator C-terminal domain-containing protein [Gordonia]
MIPIVPSRPHQGNQDSRTNRTGSRGTRQKAQLRKSIRGVSDRGWCVMDQEFNDRLCAYAVPVYDRSPRPIAALNLSIMHTSTPHNDSETELITAMTNTASRIEADLRLRLGATDRIQTH